MTNPQASGRPCGGWKVLALADSGSSLRRFRNRRQAEKVREVDVIVRRDRTSRCLPTPRHPQALPGPPDAAVQQRTQLVPIVDLMEAMT